MSRVYYNKLIRDSIQKKIESKGEHCEVRTLSDDQEYEQELLKKVSEEAKGLSVSRTREEFLSEYADLMAVLDALTDLQEVSKAEIKEAIEKNMEKKGGFKKRLFLNWSDDSGYKSNETPQGIKT